MAGSTDDLQVETERLSLSVVAPWRARDPGGVSVEFRRGTGTIERGEHVREEGSCVVLPYAVPEEATAQMLVQSRTGEPVRVRHADPSTTAGLASTDGGRSLHGPIRFRDRTGESRFTLLVGDHVEAVVHVEVVPTKVTEAERDAMRAEVEGAWAGAARSFRAGVGAHDAQGGPDSRPAWLALLREATRRLGPALAEAARQPDQRLVRERRVVPAGRLRGGSGAVRALRSGRGQGEWNVLAGCPVRERVSLDRLRPSGDTPAHRWIWNQARASRRRVRIITDEVQRSQAWERGNQTVLRSLSRLHAALFDIERDGVLHEVSGARAALRAPTVLRTHPRYRPVFDAFRLLDSGLAVAEGEIETAWRGMARLYESWAALTAVREAARCIGAPVPDVPFGARVSGPDVRVRRGARASVRLQGPRATLRIAYEPVFRGPPALLTQRPDLLLTLRSLRGPTRRAVLDAKYRRDDSDAYRQRHGAAGPPEDALGDLHRYRDAIVDADGRPLVERAAALYPNRLGKSFGDSRLWRAHADVGVGAIPLVPGQTEWLRGWLTDWIG